MILQMDEADDYVLATGETYTVREFVDKAFAIVGIAILYKYQYGLIILDPMIISIKSLDLF